MFRNQFIHIGTFGKPVGLKGEINISMLTNSMHSFKQLRPFFAEDQYHTVSVSGKYAVNHSQMRLQGVKDGLGIGIFHDFVIAEAVEQNLVIPVLSDWTIKSNYHGSIAMQYPQTKYMPARLRVFIDFISEELGNVFNKFNSQS